MNSQEYLTSHTLNPDFVASLGWTMTDTDITIPIRDALGNFLYNKIHHLTGERRFTNTGPSTLYALDKVVNKSTIFYSEGESDCARLWQEGIPSVTATTGANTKDPLLFEPLSKKNIYIILDNDEAGQKNIPSLYEAMESIGAYPKILTLPSQYKDVCEYLSDNHTGKDIIDLARTSVDLLTFSPQSIPEEFHIETMQDIINDPIPPEEWYIDRIVPTEGFLFIVGAEATGKSFYTLTIAQSLATGQSWLQSFPVTKQTNILFLDKENSRRRTKTRIEGLNIQGSDHMFRLQFPEAYKIAEYDKNGNLVATDFSIYINQFVEQNNIGVIVVDSFVDLMIGNENAVEDVQTFFTMMRECFPHKAFIVLHHENKPSVGVTRTSSHRVRGSTNITAQCVSGLRVYTPPKAQSNEYVIEQFKAGDSEKIKPFKVKLVSSPDPNNVERTVVTSIKHDGLYYDEEGAKDTAEEAILDIISQEYSVSKKDLIEKLIGFGISQRTAERAISDMVKDQKISRKTEGVKSFYYLP